MRRAWPIRIFVCLLMGVVTTVVVSWGAAFFGPPKQHDAVGTLGFVGADGGGWRVTRYRSPGVTRLVSMAIPRDQVERMEELDAAYWESPQGDIWSAVIEPLAPADVPSWSRTCHPPEASLKGTVGALAWEYASGWPCRALIATCYPMPTRTRGPAKAPPRAVGLDGGVKDGVAINIRRDTAGQVTEARILPVRPIWPGFAINIALFTMMWLASLMVVTTVRSTARRRRGRCPRCGYDLRYRVRRACPECGRSG
jgi:hypothetical protein